MQEASVKNPIISKNKSTLKITITGSEAISALNTKNLKDLNPYERLAHVKNNINQQRLIQKKSTAINDKKETLQHVKPSSLLSDNPQYKFTSKPQLPTKQPLERNDSEPAYRVHIEFLNKKINEIPKASIKVGSRQQYKCLPPNNTINKQLPHDGELLPEKQFHSTIKVPHNLTNEKPKASIKAVKRQCLSLNNEIYKQLPHEEELLAAKQSTVTVNVSHNTTDEITKASVKVGNSQCLSSNNTINKQLPLDGELLAVKRSSSTENVTHNPTNEISKASIKAGESECLSVKNIVNENLSVEGELLTEQQSCSAVSVPHNSTNETSKVSFIVVENQKQHCISLSLNNTINTRLRDEEEFFAVNPLCSTVEVPHNPTNEIPKASIKAEESEQQKLKYLPSNNTVFKQLSNEEELLTEQESHFTVSVPHSPANKTSKTSIKVVEIQKLQDENFSLKNTINNKLTDEGEFLAVKQLYSMVEVPHNSTNEIPKASIKVGNNECMPSNNTIYNQLPSNGKLLAVKRSSSPVNVSHNPTNEIPKASIKTGESGQQKLKYLPSDNTVFKQLSKEEELLTEQQSHFTVSVSHSPANKTSKTSIKVVEVQKQQCKSLSFNDAINKKLPNDAEHLTVKVANKPKTKIPKASVKVGKSQCLSSNNTIYKQLLQDGKPLAATKIPKAIEAGESERLKFNCLPSSNTVYNQLSDEGELLTEQQAHATVNMPQSPTNETPKASVKVGEDQKLQSKSLSLNNTINIKLPDEEEQLAVKQPCSTIKFPQNSTNVVPKASVKVGKKRLSSNNTIYEKLQCDGKVSAVEQIYSTVSYTKANKIPKASIKMGKSKQHKCLSPNKTIIESLPFDGEQLNAIHNATNEIPKASIKVGTRKK